MEFFAREKYRKDRTSHLSIPFEFLPLCNTSDENVAVLQKMPKLGNQCACGVLCHFYDSTAFLC